MAITGDYGYVAPQYFSYYRTRIYSGYYVMHIENDKVNYVYEKYDDGWDYPRRAREYIDEQQFVRHWEYILDANGNHPTVSGDGANIVGTKGNDSVDNYSADDVKINGGGGDDTITNRNGKNSKLDGGKGSDLIINFRADYVRIDGGAGGDEIYNGGSFVDQDPNYTAGGNYVTINGGAGNDHISNGNGNNDAKNVLINGGAGNDDISNGGKSVTINAGDGKDTIANTGSQVTISSSAGNDDISNRGKSVTINAGDGDDTIGNSGSNVKISSGEGKDTITNSGSQVSISAGKGNDYISNKGKNVTISAGDGKDTITNSGSKVSISGGDGENTISLTGGKDISIKGGEDTETFIVKAYSGLTASIQSGKGKNIIKFLGDWGYGGNFLSVSGGVNEVSSFQTSNNTLISGAGNDSVTISSDYNSIFAGTYDTSADGLDADYILLKSGSNNTIDTGGGKDKVWIKDVATSNTIHTGQSTDSVRNEGANNLINTGGGKDTIDNWGQFVTIQAGDQETAGGKNSVTNHVDFVTILGGNESDTITNYMGKGVSVNGGAGNDIIRLYSIEAPENILDAALRPLLNAAKDFNAKKINEVIEMYNELAEYIEDFSKISQVETTYKGKNQIKIRGKIKEISDKAGELCDKLEEIEGALGDKGYDYEKITQLKKGAAKIKKVAGKAMKLTDNTEIITGMMKDYADNKIWSTFGKELASDFERDANGRLTFVWKKSYRAPATVRGGKGNDKIYGDERSFYVYEYKAGDGNDTIYNWNSNDTLKISGGTYTGKIVKGNYVVYVGKGSVTFKNYTSRRITQVVVNGSYEQLPCQIEGKEATAGRHVASGSYRQAVEPPPEGLSVDGDKLTAAKNFSGEINAAKSYAEYVTRINASDTTGNVEIIGTDSVSEIISGKGNDNVHSTGSFTVICSGAGKDIVSSSGDYCIINTGAGNDVIVNVGSYNTIDAGTGNDTIISDGKKNLFTVNDGDNKIIYGFGKTDTLQIADDRGKYSAKKSGDDVIVTADGGKITLAGATDLKKINISAVKTKAASKVSIDALAGNDSILGNAGNDKLYGGKGNDSLWGGAGNDALYGGDGKDTFIYKPGEGTDTIFDYEAGDMLTILKSNGKAGGSFTSSKFSGGNLTLSINGGGKVIFDNVSANDSFNINGKSYSISGTKLK